MVEKFGELIGINLEELAEKLELNDILNVDVITEDQKQTGLLLTVDVPKEETKKEEEKPKKGIAGIWKKKTKKEEG